MLVFPLVAFCWVTFRLGPIGFLSLASLAIAFPFVQAFDATRIAWNIQDSPLGRCQRWWIYLVVFLFGYVSNYGNAMLVKTFIAEVFMVPTRAMAPTIQPGDRIVVDKLWTRADSLKRRDIVVYQSIQDPLQLHVMRVLGLPGETITIEGAKTTVDDSDIDVPEAHTDGLVPPGFVAEQLRESKDNLIGPGSFFVVGDNRYMSYDSRFVGAIPNRNFHATAVNILWSQPRLFPKPNNTTNYTLGPIEWTRLGRSLRSDHE
jgi:signal peptidase I